MFKSKMKTCKSITPRPRPRNTRNIPAPIPQCFLCLDSTWPAVTISGSSPIPKTCCDLLGLAHDSEHLQFFKSLFYCTKCIQLLLNYCKILTNFHKIQNSLFESTKVIRNIILRNYEGIQKEDNYDPQSDVSQGQGIDTDFHEDIDMTPSPGYESEPEVILTEIENGEVHTDMLEADPIGIDSDADQEDEDFQLDSDDVDYYQAKPSVNVKPNTRMKTRQRQAKSASSEEPQAKKSSYSSCPKCDKSFKTQKLLQEHIRDIHYEVIQCPTCDKSVPEPLLQSHIKAMHPDSVSGDGVAKKRVTFKSKGIVPSTEDGRFHCEIENCGKSYKTARYLEDHKLTSHNKNTEETQVSCPVCEKLFRDRLRLKYHIINTHKNNGKPRKPKPKVHKPKTEEEDPDQPKPRYECSICNRTYKTPRYLRDHQLSHKEGLNAVCSLCGGLYKNKHCLRWHMRSVHPQTQSFDCDSCSYQAKTKNALTAHKAKIHATSKQTWTCEICGKVIYSSLHTFLNHKRKAHELEPGQKPLSCNLCSKTFALRDYLRDHVIKKHIKIGLGSNNSSSAIKKNETHLEQLEPTNPTLLKLCKELNINLHNHIKTKTYKCVFCPTPTVFPMKNYLKSHMRKFHLFRKGKYEELIVDKDILTQVCTDLNLPIPIRPVIRM